jgi:GNAT superfamily N-acetyltransferase
MAPRHWDVSRSCVVTVEVRPAVADDVEAIQDIGRQTWPPTYSFAGADYVANGLATFWSREALLQSLLDTTVLVAVSNGQVVGIGNIDLRRAVPVIWKLYILPHEQGSGVGSALMTALLNRVPAGIGTVQLEYVDGNEKAAAFYTARGFTELRREPGERPGWPDTVWVERQVAVASPRPI